MTTIALDAMGGDHGLVATVDGAADLSREEVDVHVLLVGDVAAIDERLRLVRYDPTRLSVVAAEGAVGMGDAPREALDRLPRCSVLTAARLVRDGDADALVSAGNTGATILAAAESFERLPGIRRG